MPQKMHTIENGDLETFNTALNDKQMKDVVHM